MTNYSRSHRDTVYHHRKRHIQNDRAHSLNGNDGIHWCNHIPRQPQYGHRRHNSSHHTTYDADKLNHVDGIKSRHHPGVHHGGGQQQSGSVANNKQTLLLLMVADPHKNASGGLASIIWWKKHRCSNLTKNDIAQRRRLTGCLGVVYVRSGDLRVDSLSLSHS